MQKKSVLSAGIALIYLWHHFWMKIHNIVMVDAGDNNYNFEVKL